MDIKIIFKKDGKILVNGKEFDKERFNWNLSGGTLTLYGYEKRPFGKWRKVTIRNNDYSIFDYR